MHSLEAQDVHFSQFNTSSSYLNPAFTGAFEGSFRIRAINRDQWIGFEDQPLRTFAILGDIKLGLKGQKITGDHFGLGIHFLTDRVQPLDYNTNEASVSIAYHKRLTKKTKNYVSGGISFGVHQKSINYEDLLFEDQFDGVNSYPFSTKELLPPNIFAVPEIKLGIQLNSQINNALRIQSGLSTQYTFAPEFSYYSTVDDPDYKGTKTSKAFTKIALLTNLIYYLDNLNQLYPRLLYSKQGPHQLAIVGVNFRHAFYSLNESAVHAGVAIRIPKSEQTYLPADLSFMAGIEFKSFILGLSYDFGLKDLIAYKNPSHSFEISLSLIGDYNNEGFICPEF